MSFGYYDKDWIDPDPVEFEVENQEIVIQFEDYDDSPSIIEIEDSSIVDAPEFEDYFDPDFDVFIASGYELDEIVFDALEPYIPTTDDGLEYIDGKYQISGQMIIHYTIEVPTNGSYVDEDMYEPFEVEINPNPELKNIKLTPIQ